MKARIESLDRLADPAIVSRMNLAERERSSEERKSGPPAVAESERFRVPIIENGGVVLGRGVEWELKM